MCILIVAAGSASSNDTATIDANGNLLPPRSGNPFNFPNGTKLGGTPLSANPRVFDVDTYGAVGNASTDDAASIQSALNAASSAGGGVVRLQWNKRYRIASAISVPRYVSLEGAQASWHRQITDYGDSIQPVSNLTSGTLIYVDFGVGGSDTATAAITLNAHSALRGLSIYYPNAATSGTPTIYPFAIRTAEYDVTIRDIDLVNPYRGIDMQSGRVQIDNVHGEAIALGLRVDHMQDVSHITNVQFIDSWSRSLSGISAWRQANGIAFDFKRADLIMCENLFALFYHVAYKFEIGFGGIGTQGCFLSASSDACDYGIQDYGSSTSGLPVTWTNSDHCSNSSAFSGDHSTGGYFEFTSTSFRQCGYGANNLTSLINLDGSGRTVELNGCHFYGTSNTYAIDATGACALNISGGSIDGGSTTIRNQSFTVHGEIGGLRSYSGDPVLNNAGGGDFNVLFTSGIRVAQKITGNFGMLLNGADFELDDGGTPDSNGVRVFTSSHNLFLQYGSGGHVYVRNASGATVGDLATVFGSQSAADAFEVSLGSAANAGNAALLKVPFNVKSYDSGSNFDATTNHQFTAPTTGKYLFNWTITTTNATTRLFTSLMVNGTETYRGQDQASSVNPATVGGSVETALTVGDTVYVACYSNNGVALQTNSGVLQTCYFSGHFLGQ